MRRWFALFTATTGVVFGLTLGVATPRALADESSAGDEDKQEQQIRTKLEDAPDLKNNRIDVDVDDGIAVLEGTVDSKREKKEATQLAHVDGILGVNNRLVVRGAAK